MIKFNKITITITITKPFIFDFQNKSSKFIQILVICQMIHMLNLRRLKKYI
jgi:hypothetical protein